MTVSHQIMRRLRARGRGAVFSATDFLDLANRAAVDQTLTRLARRGTVRRLKRGLYDYPRVDPRLGALSPSPDAVAQAVARQTNSIVQIDGAQAANSLGLSTQVPAQPVYLTNGPSRRVQIGRRVIALKHVSPKKLIAAGTRAGTVVQALRYLGPNAAIPLQDVAARILHPRDRQALAREAAKAPVWMQSLLARIAHAA